MVIEIFEARIHQLTFNMLNAIKARPKASQPSFQVVQKVTDCIWAVARIIVTRGSIFELLNLDKPARLEMTMQNLLAVCNTS